MSIVAGCAASRAAALCVAASRDAGLVDGDDVDGVDGGGVSTRGLGLGDGDGDGVGGGGGGGGVSTRGLGLGDGDDGVVDDGAVVDGVVVDGVVVDGVVVDGVVVDGVAEGGVAEGGVADDGVADDGCGAVGGSWTAGAAACETTSGPRVGRIASATTTTVIVAAAAITRIRRRRRRAVVTGICSLVEAAPERVVMVCASPGRPWPGRSGAGDAERRSPVMASIARMSWSAVWTRWPGALVRRCWTRRSTAGGALMRESARVGAGTWMCAAMTSPLPSPRNGGRPEQSSKRTQPRA